MKAFPLIFCIGNLGVMAYSIGQLPSQQKSVPIPAKVDFNRDIRPILANKCLNCHGNDKGAVMAGLRLDNRTSATAKLKSGRFAIVPGKPNASTLVQRVHAPTNSGIVMPPASSNKALTSEEKFLLKLWIQQGAEFKQHWAFVKPTLPAVPTVKNGDWPINPIDNFILSRLEEMALMPNGDAEKATLLRRVSLDITGIPPTIEEQDAFAKDDSPNAYEKVVDRLLASPRYGERMAMDWMDYARYADSNGYQADFERFQWKWRDYVINAYNDNMPYDQFTIEQLAGDLLPNPTLDQRVATGFNRNHRINTEGGVIPEEWRVETVIDRVETTSTVWLGLSTGCARCHDHKYDPISQKEFYSLFAYFNNVPETGSGEERPVNHPPFIYAPSPEQSAMLEKLKSERGLIEMRIEQIVQENLTPAKSWNYVAPKAPASLEQLRTFNLPLSEASKPKIFGKPAFEKGRLGAAVATNGDSYLEFENAGDFERDQPFSFAAWIYPQSGGAPFGRMKVSENYRGWDLFMDSGRPMVHLISNWPDNAIKVRSKAAFPENKWMHVAVTVDGSSKASGIQIFVNGTKVQVETEVDKLTGSIRTDANLSIGRRTGGNMFTGKVEDLKLYSKVLADLEVAALASHDPVPPLIQIPEAERTPEQSRELARLYARAKVPEFTELETNQMNAAKRLAQAESEIPSVMVMQEMPKPRTAYILERGLYDKHGAVVGMGTPKALPPIPKGAPNNRLGLAKWIVSPNNPLTARVTINRLWERFFGQGIVVTSEDFGTRADFPTHPELLDWLSVRFVESGWDLKAAIKRMVMSRTYRQSSAVSAAKLAKDPTNKLYARGARFRLPAEVLRDQALFAANLLREKLGGPSVRPHAPKGMWDEFGAYGNLRDYKPESGEGLHRRSLYTIWKRTASPPNMTMFDVPTRETCRVRRARTNTPLQALTLMNDETYVEAARGMAQAAISLEPRGDAPKIRAMVRALLAREPRDAEIAVLSAAASKRRIRFRTHPDEATKLVKVGMIPTVPGQDPIEVATFTLVASTLLNLDEAVTKE
jgi:hypothetical protein